MHMNNLIPVSDSFNYNGQTYYTIGNYVDIYEISSIAFGPNTIDIKSFSIPSNIKHVILLDEFNQEIPKDYFPNTVTTITINNISKPLAIGSLSNIKNVYLNDGFNHPIESGILPTTIQKLFLSSNLNCKLFSSNSIPDSRPLEIFYSEPFNHSFFNNLKNNNIKLVKQ
ncbi:hypothetical protein RB653_010545 [Dictyostelium firmibasis]|uniref:FNIP repeat-containing protein n=1 Tax=Dictyostelium firmibasis TaxID=79012 RepID=A0AAN7TU46_9MYCE